MQVKYPFISISLIFILGILANYFSEFASDYFIIPIVICLLIGTAIFLLRSKFNLSNPTIIILHITFFLLGNFLLASKREIRNYVEIPNELKKEVVFIGSLNSIELPRENEIVFEIRTDSIRINNLYKVIEINLLCRIRDKIPNLRRLYDKILPGNKIRANGFFQEGMDVRNPGGFDYKSYLSSKGLNGLLIVNDSYNVKVIDERSNFIKSLVFTARKAIDTKITELHNKQATGLLRGLILADRSSIDYETKTQFINSGVMHILAVSGLHVGYIALIFLFLFGRFNIYTKSVLTIIGLIGFLFLTGMPASVFRAVTMAVVIIIAYISNRSSNIYNSLAIAAFIILLINPYELFSPGFQLSFSAVLSIAVIYPILQKFIYSLKLKSKLLNYVLLFIGVSLSAQIGTLPLTIIYFGKISLVSLLTNLFVIPLAGAIVGIAIFTLLLSLILPAVAGLIAAANNFIILILFNIVSYAGGSDKSFVSITHYTILDAVIFYFAVLLTIAAIKWSNSLKAKLILLFLIIANSILFGSLDDRRHFDDWKLNLLMLDINQGSSILIKFPNKQTILVNGGNATFNFDSGDRIIKPVMNYLNIDLIDAAIITNMERHYFTGMISLIRDGRIKKVIKPMIDSSNVIDIQFEEFAAKHNVPLSNINLSKLEIGGAAVYFLSNQSQDQHFDSLQSKIKRSVIFKIVFCKTSFLFIDNLNPNVSNLFMNFYRDFLKSDVVIFHNRIKNFNSSFEFLNFTKPKLCLVSTRNHNKFQQSNLISTEHVDDLSFKVYSTNESGAIWLQSDGNVITKIMWK